MGIKTLQLKENLISDNEPRERGLSIYELMDSLSVLKEFCTPFELDVFGLTKISGTRQEDVARILNYSQPLINYQLKKIKNKCSVYTEYKKLLPYVLQIIDDKIIEVNTLTAKKRNRDSSIHMKSKNYCIRKIAAIDAEIKRILEKQNTKRFLKYLDIKRLTKIRSIKKELTCRIKKVDKKIANLESLDCLASKKLKQLKDILIFRGQTNAFKHSKGRCEYTRLLDWTNVISILFKKKNITEEAKCVHSIKDDVMHLMKLAKMLSSSEKEKVIKPYIGNNEFVIDSMPIAFMPST